MASPLTDSPTHGELQSLAAALESASVPAMFEFDPQRASDFRATGAGLALDYAKQLSEKAYSSLGSVSVASRLLPGNLKDTAGQAYQHAQDMYSTLKPVRCVLFTGWWKLFVLFV